MVSYKKTCIHGLYNENAIMQMAQKPKSFKNAKKISKVKFESSNFASLNPEYLMLCKVLL